VAIVANLVPDPVPTHTVNDLLLLYLSDFLPLKADITQYHHRKYFARMQAEFGTLPLDELTPAFLRAYRDRLRTRYSPGTVRLYCMALSAALQTAVQELGWLATNPLRQVRLPAPAHHHVRFLSEDERPRLLTACQASLNPALYTVVLVALGTGMRKAEILTLHWDAIDLGRSTIRLLQTKNGASRGVPLPQVVREVLQRWWERRQLQTPWVFPNRSGRKPMDISQAWENARARAGLTDFRFHDLRHTCASYLAMNGASMREIAEVLGHKTMAMTLRYTHLSSRHTAGVVERMADAFLPPTKERRHD